MLKNKQWARLLLGLIFLGAAAGKLTEPSAFVQVFRYLTGSLGLDLTAARALAASVVAWEVLLGTVLLLGVARTWAFVATIATLVLFTFVLVFLTLDSRAPSCGCFLLTSEIKSHGAIAIVRNSALLGLAVWMALPMRNTHRSVVAPQGSKQSPAVSRPGNGAFSLTELLVAIFILGILIAVSLPALSRAYYEAKTTRSLSTNRQLLAALELYTGDYDATFPYLGTRGRLLEPIRVRTFALPDSASYGYFTGQSRYWISVVYPEYFSNRGEIQPSALLRRAKQVGFPDFVVRSSFELTNTAFAAPEYWADPAWIYPPNELLRPTRSTEVRHPSLKGLLLDTWRGAPSPERASTGDNDLYVGFGDGSARLILPNETDPSRFVGRPAVHGRAPGLVMTTRHGLSGIDAN